MIIHQSKIIDIVNHSEDIKTFYIDKPQDMHWQEGAHTHLALAQYELDDPQRKQWVRHMSIMTCVDEDILGITTKTYANASPYKNELWKLKIGDELKVFKSHSRLTLKREDKDIYLISMGVGLASLYPLIKAYKKDTEGVKSLTNLTISKHALLYQDIAENDFQSFTNILVENRDSFYEKLSNLNHENALYYVVGSDEFLVDVIQHLRKFSVSKEQVILDKNELLSYYFLSLLD